MLSEPHHILVDGVVEHFLQQHVHAIVALRAVAQASDIHAGTQAYMLAPVECLDVVAGVV